MSLSSKDCLFSNPTSLKTLKWPEIAMSMPKKQAIISNFLKIYVFRMEIILSDNTTKSIKKTLLPIKSFWVRARRSITDKILDCGDILIPILMTHALFKLTAQSMFIWLSRRKENGYLSLYIEISNQNTQSKGCPPTNVFPNDTASIPRHKISHGPLSINQTYRNQKGKYWWSRETSQSNDLQRYFYFRHPSIPNKYLLRFRLGSKTSFSQLFLRHIL